VINEHYNTSPSDKVHSLSCCRSALLINDDKEAFKKCYPMAPVWKDVDDCVEKIEYYLKNQKEREELVKQMGKQSLSFTYEKQLKKVLEAL